MKEIAIQYFSWGWIITTLVMAGLGGLFGVRSDIKSMCIACLIALMLGLVMLHFKNC